MPWLDPIGASLSLLSTYYFTRAYRIAWMVGIAAILVNSLLYWQKGIYGHVLLEAFYLMSMVYGLRESSRPIHYLSQRTLFILGLLALSSILVGAQILRVWTGSDVPYWDATTTVLSLLAQYLLCIKAIQCWILWFAVDAMVALLHLYKGIPFHSLVKWMYLGLAVLGYCRWRRLYRTGLLNHNNSYN